MPEHEPLTNAHIAELLAMESETAKMPAKKALRRASRRALFWPEEAAALIEQGRSLTELVAVGPYLEKMIARWIDNPPAVPDPPAIRRQFLTRTAARKILAQERGWLSQVKGDLQMHTTWSDGEGAIAEMAEAAQGRGYEYIGITDHSKGLKIAGGINEQQLQEQAEEIAGANERFRAKRFRVLRSVELNLNPSGDGDMEPEALARLDVVLGCFHSSLRRPEDQTERYLKALRNPDIHILGHPRGRIYNFRLGLTADWTRVFALAAELDKAVEIDGYPDRQDLNVDLLRIAKKEGCRISLGTDSHGPSQLDFIEFSAAAALKAGIASERILNFKPVEELLVWAANLRQRARLAA
jgi:DNA polymerase (family 10)